MSDVVPPAAGQPLVCPDCGKGRLTGTGLVRCSAKGCVVDVHRFAPVVDVVPAGDAGRCARHPAKDGVAGCSRCGAFICDVCVTRTGEQVLCPACFDLLHARGELATTKSSRFRMDYVALLLALVSVFCWGVGIPFSLGLSIYGLRRRRTDPWLSKPILLTALVLSVLQILVVVVVIVAIATRKGS